ncbi:MAG: type II toxin-antitoxin system VapC family toxin [Kiritimatiellae bacterium]|nr:type II toxin-antitoxin system VapC family toxin [Kiritimatiellia bacterium]
MKVCLDTNAYSNLRRGNQRLLELLNECDEILVPAATYAELTYGFLRGGRLDENESLLNSFLEEKHVSFQPVTQSIAERWGYVKAALAQKGTPIPENDIWIAATALETGARLVSYDRHFDSVGGLIRLAP